jgi:general secretion pathway protein A
MSETYYGRFYGFDSAPFHITPDPSLLFATETHQQAVGAIEYGIAAGKGFIVITGEVGVGKTTVLRICLDRLEPSKNKIIYLFNPALTIAELYATILEGLDDSFHRRCRNAADTLRRLHRALLAMHEAGTQVILAVDEAQNMPEQTLESLRMLSNLETAKSKLLQIILVGQPELEAVLAKHSLRQLAQRVAVRARIKPLTARQSCRYIQHRSQCAGRIGNPPLFTAPALWYLAVTSHGIPRTINICCDNALINGYGHGAQRISLKVARESCRALQLRSPFRRLAVLAAAAVVFVGIVFYGDAFLQRFLAAPARGKVLEFAWRDRPPAYEADVTKASAPPPVAAAPLPRPPSTTEAVRAPLAPVTEATNASPPVLTAAVRPVVEEVPAEAPPAPRPDAVRAAAIAAPMPAMVPTAELPQTAAASAAVEPTNRPDPQPVWKWLVRKGDTVYKVCRVTYGVCDETALHAVFAYNPQIGPNGIIRQGEVIIMPERGAPVRSN